MGYKKSIFVFDSLRKTILPGLNSSKVNSLEEVAFYPSSSFERSTWVTQRLIIAHFKRRLPPRSGISGSVFLLLCGTCYYPAFSAVSHFTCLNSNWAYCLDNLYRGNNNNNNITPRFSSFCVNNANQTEDRLRSQNFVMSDNRRLDLLCKKWCLLRFFVMKRHMPRSQVSIVGKGS